MQTQLSEKDILSNMELVLKLVEKLPNHDNRKDRVKKMLEGKVGQIYFSAPASSKTEFHSCFAGGLASHSLNVVSNLYKLTESLTPGKFDKSTLIFVGLFHDLGKAGDGINEYYIHNESQWHREKLGQLYEINKHCKFAPTSERGLFVLQDNEIKLSYNEYLAIRLNDGQYDDTNKNYKMKEPPLALLVHWADMWACQQEKSV